MTKADFNLSCYLLGEPEAGCWNQGWSNLAGRLTRDFSSLLETKQLQPIIVLTRLLSCCLLFLLDSYLTDFLTACWNKNPMRAGTKNEWTAWSKKEIRNGGLGKRIKRTGDMLLLTRLWRDWNPRMWLNARVDKSLIFKLIFRLPGRAQAQCLVGQSSKRSGKALTLTLR